MRTEIEVKFADIDIEEVRERLRTAGATCEQPMRLMRRAVIEQKHHEAEKSFIRIRDEGDKATLTYKKRKSDSLHGATEIEVTISDFSTTVELFTAAGWPYNTLQESRRETWSLEGAEVVIDEWPWLRPYIEIEAASETIVRQAAKHLSFDWTEAVFGSVDVLYKRNFPNMSVRGVIDVPDVRFGDPVPSVFGVAANGS